MENKTYEIKSFEHLLNIINKENCERLATDCALWLIEYSRIIEALREKHPEKYQGKSNWEIAEGGFNWIDDGEQKINGWKTTIKETGETRFYKYPNKD